MIKTLKYLMNIYKLQKKDDDEILRRVLAQFGIVDFITEEDIEKERQEYINE